MKTNIPNLLKEQREPKKLFIIYDERANYDLDRAAVMVTCDTLEEARSYKGDFGVNCPIYSYDSEGDNLINEKFIETMK